MLRGECDADVTLVPNLSSFRADIDFPQINISSVGWENSLAMRSRIFSRTDLFRSTGKDYGLRVELSPGRGGCGSLLSLMSRSE
jgi:hypothetical protein